MLLKSICTFFMPRTAHVVHIGMHRARARNADDDVVKNTLTEAWKTFHDICSVVALDSAFSSCQEGDEYDLGKVGFIFTFRRCLNLWLYRGRLAVGWPQSMAHWPS